jgi:hypothetical protein
MLWYWLDRNLLSPLKSDWRFAAVISALLCICVILCVLNRESQQYFSQRENYGKQPKNTKT